MTRRRYPESALPTVAGRPWADVRRPRLPWLLRRLRRRLFYVTVRIFVGLVRGLPRPVGLGFLRGLGAVAFRVRSRDRRVATVQLQRALPGLDAERRARMARESLDALARNLVDMLRRDVDVIVDAQAHESMQRAREAGPVMVLMAHCGAWEAIGPLLVDRLPPFAALTADPHNEWVDRWLRRERRARGITVFDRERELRPALRWLRDGGTLAVLGDHRTRGSQIPAPWFGVDAPTATGPSRMARAARAQILPVGIRRDGDAHRLEVGTAFVPSGDDAADARRCNAALEDLILRQPEEWTWTHDRYGDLA